MLEPKADEKYYLPEEKAVMLTKQLESQKDSDNVEMVGLVEGISGHDICKRVYSTAGVSPTLLTCTSGNSTPKISDWTPKIERIGNTNPSGKGMCGSVYKDTGLSPTLNTNEGGGVRVAEEIRPVLAPERGEKRHRHGVAIGTYPNYRIRKLTPRECWRIQGLSDEQFDKAKGAGISDTQLYKQAGNAVTTHVIHAIGKRLVAMLQEEEVSCA